MRPLPLAELPLLRRFPALAKLPRAAFGAYPTPVQRITLASGRRLLVKRDDLSGTLIGGNKVRGLEWLLGDVRRGDHVVTVGPKGSTHALTTATYALSLGARVTVVRWNQEMNAAARRIADRLESTTPVINVAWVPAAYVVAGLLRLRGARWVPAGGATPLAILGQVNAALELADQIAAGECELPERLVVPLGTGGTAAGLALGLRIAKLGTQIIAVRVVPRILGRARRVARLANATAALIERHTGERLSYIRDSDVRVEHAFYGGGYGRPLDVSTSDETTLQTVGARLDDTYSRKAFAASLTLLPGHETMLWLTFDGRLLQDSAP